MKNYYILILIGSLFLASCSISPCGTKDGFIKKHKKFVTQTVDKVDDLSNNDWEEKDETFKKLVEECYEKHKNDFSSSEKKDFWELNTKYYTNRYGKSIDVNSISNDIKNFFEDDLKVTINGVEDELREVFDEDFKNELRGNLHELKGGLLEMTRELKKELNNFLSEEDGLKDELKRELQDFMKEKDNIKEELKSELKDLLKEKEGLRKELESLLDEKE